MLGIKINEYIDYVDSYAKLEIGMKVAKYLIENWDDKVKIIHEDDKTTDLELDL